jgi:hypothetical protein
MPRAARKNVGGRPTIFGTRDGDTVHGRLTKYSTKRFTQARRELARMAGWEAENVSDSDTLEYLTRGETATREFLAAKKASGQ